MTESLRPLRRVDVCNGDADGLCALLQLRLSEPRETELVTGLKREIDLLQRVDAGNGDEVTVLDVSLDRNRDALMRLLERGVRIRYFDHHYAGPLPAHPGLVATIDPAPGVCTSILVDRYLQGAYRRWAVVGAFGDNLAESARRLAATAGLDSEQCARLQDLGVAINYNAYGETEADVAVHPRELYRLMRAFADPLEFNAHEPAVMSLLARCRDDMAVALRIPPSHEDAQCALFRLPDAPWSRRVLGSFANRLATDFPRRAHAVLKANGDGTYRASVRAPLVAPFGADGLCRRFAGGGGRAGAAGFERLPAADLDRFIVEFTQTAWNRQEAG